MPCFFRSLLIAAIAIGCRANPGPPKDGASEPATAAPNRRQADSTLTRILSRYTVPDSETGGLNAVNRFDRLTDAQLSDLIEPSDSCDAYFALRSGTYCLRQRYGESLQVHDVDQRHAIDLLWADTLARVALGASTYDSLRSLLIYRNLVRSASARCATMEVFQKSQDRATLTHENFWDAPDGILLSGIGCGSGNTALRGLPLTRGTRVLLQLWDRIAVSSGTVWLFRSVADECDELLVYQEAGDSVTLLQTIGLGCL